MIEKDDVQMFNPHAPLDLFCFVFSCSLFFALSPVYLNAWNGLFGYDSVNNVKLFAKKRLKMCPMTQYFISSWFTKRFRRISLHTFTGLLPHTQKRFHNTVEALAQLVLFMAALIKLLIKFLISTNKKNSHMRLTPVTNTYPSLFTFVFHFLGSFANKSVYLQTAIFKIRNGERGIFKSGNL